MEFRSEKGAVIILFSVLSLVLIGFIALAVDLYRGASTRDQVVSFVQSASLAAVEEYYDNGKLTHPERKEKVRARVQKLLDVQLNDGKPLMTSRNLPQVIYDPPGAPEYLTKDEISERVIVHGGNFYYTMDEAQSCGADASDYPCFIRESAEDVQVNAFKLYGGFAQYSWSSFANVLLSDMSSVLELNVGATATTVPRLGCFLVDLSPSVTYETHKPKSLYNEKRFPYGNPPRNSGPYRVEPGYGRLFSLILSEDNDNVDYTIYDPKDCEDVENDFNSAQASGNWNSVQNRHNDTRAGWTSVKCQNERPGFKPAPPSGVTESDVHHRYENYTIKKTLGDSDYTKLDEVTQSMHPDPRVETEYAVGDDGLFYRIETFLGPTNIPPRPLEQVMKGLAHAIDAFDERNVAGDEVCLIFFDTELSWTRVVKPTENFDYLKEFVKYEKTGVIESDKNPTFSQTDFDNEISVSYDSPSINNFERALRFGLFPGFHEETDEILSEPFTDIPQALRQTLDLLHDKNMDGVPRSAFITLITDGLTNCHSDTGSTICDSKGDVHLRSVEQLYRIAELRLQPGRIPLHVILMGEHVAPHTLVIKDPEDPNKCLSDREARIKDIPYTSGEAHVDINDYNDDFETLSAQNPWYNANPYMYNLTKKTQGVFGPIRKHTDCVPLEDSCSSRTDGERLETDPFCETPQQQINRYMEQIIAENPYVIVDSS